jgi:hypothetical protein
LGALEGVAQATQTPELKEGCTKLHLRLLLQVLVLVLVVLVLPLMHGCGAVMVVVVGVGHGLVVQAVVAPLQPQVFLKWCKLLRGIPVKDRWPGLGVFYTARGIQEVREGEEGKGGVGRALRAARAGSRLEHSFWAASICVLGGFWVASTGTEVGSAGCGWAVDAIGGVPGRDVLRVGVGKG